MEALTMKLTNNNFNNSPIIFGDNNTVSINTNNAIDWEKITAEFSVLLKKLPQDSQEFDVCSELLTILPAKNTTKIKEFMKAHSLQFTSNLFCNIASAILISFVSSLLI